MALLSTSITLTINGGETKDLGGTLAQFPDVNPLLNEQFTLASGTGSLSAQKVGLESFSLAGGASVTLDLQAFAGPFGVVAFSKVRQLVIVVDGDRGYDVASD